MSKNIAYRNLAWLAVVLWMILIFSLSAQSSDQSDGLSTGITQSLLRFIQELIPGLELDLGLLNHLIRKAAHFTIYLILGILVMNALKTSGIVGGQAFVLALSICLLYAISDEVHQRFVPGRGGQVRDVLIDSAGALLGVLLRKTKGD